MRKGSRWVGLVVSLALIFVMTVGTISAQASIYRVGKYDIYYSNYTEYTWARALGRYVPEAWRAAYTVIGNKTLNGQMQVRFYSKRDNHGGYMYGGTQEIYLNRYYFFSYAKWGEALSHETSHVLFFNYTKATTWNRNRNMETYSNWITESLAMYTGFVAYRYGPRWSKSALKSNLKYFASRSGRQTFYSMGYNYYYGRGNSLNTAIYGQAATGYFLTGGLTTSTSRNVYKLMYAMKAYSSSYGSYLRSSNYKTALYYFEYTFKRATGYYANAGLIYGSINNTKYLMGKFYYQWYV